MELQRAWDYLLESLPFPWYVGSMLLVTPSFVKQSKPNHVRALTRGINDILFRNMPPVPESGKWAKAFPLLAWLLQGFLLLGLLCPIMACALEGKAAQVKRKRARKTRVGDDDSDPDFADWHATCSKRAANSLSFLRDRRSRMHILCYALVMEPIKWLTDKFIEA